MFQIDWLTITPRYLCNHQESGVITNGSSDLKTITLRPVMATRQVTLELTLEQEETIKALFGHSNWEYKEIKPKSGNAVFIEIFILFFH